MIFGMTNDEYEAQINKTIRERAKWTKRFAWFPTRINVGTRAGQIVWLEHYWVKLVFNRRRHGGVILDEIYTCLENPLA
jgi:hypothetical protein